MKEDIKIAKTAGFCMGVRRAVELALDEGNKKDKTQKLHTFGPLIHNPQVLKLLEDKDISCIETIPDKGEGTIIIRAHGIPPKTKQDLKDVGFKVLDATCPRVIKVQAIIKKHAAKGFNVVIVGDHDHAEVIGLAGYAGEMGYVVNSIKEFEELPEFEKAIVVAQTTQNTKFYAELEEKFTGRFPTYKFFNTICDSTEKRQNEIKSIAKDVDAVIVVGGKTSGNTKRLQEVASQQGTTALHIESHEELDHAFIADKEKIGITAGASTPNWVISQVYREIKTAKLKKNKNFLVKLYVFLKFLLRANILLSIGAGAITTAVSILLNIKPIPFNAVLTASLYIFSIHTLNNLTLINSDKFNDPQKALMYENNKKLIFTIAIFAGCLGLFFSYSLGRIPFLIIVMMSIGGLCYKIPIIKLPGSSDGFKPFSEVPGSKAFLIAAAWGIICTMIPAFAGDQAHLNKIPGLLVSFIFCASMAFLRTTCIDIIAIQGNKIAGEITIPVLIGEEKTSKILKFMLCAVISILYIASFLGFTSKFGYILAIYPAVVLGVIITSEQKIIRQSFFGDLISESMFLAAGILGFIYTMFI